MPLSVMAARSRHSPGARDEAGGEGVRLCFVGDSLTTGVGDEGWNGWPQRLCAAERRRGREVTPYNLGIRGDTSQDIRDRWFAECNRRLGQPFAGGLVFNFGVNDTQDRNGERRLPLDRSIENARSVVALARSWKPTIWIAPLPIDPAREPCRVRTGGIEYTIYQGRIAELADAFALVAADLGVPFVMISAALAGDQRWLTGLSSGDGIHPVGQGYARIADAIEEHPLWRHWLDGTLRPEARASRLQLP
jgi:acyl-CoA thioesterase-1